MKFGTNLKQARIKRGFSVKAVADATGIKLKTLWNIENVNVSFPKIPTVKKLEKLFGKAIWEWCK